MAMSRRELILRSLEDGYKRWSDLERELVRSGRMGSATLSSHLKALEKEGLVRRIVDSTHWPSTTQYSLNASDFSVREQIVDILKEIQLPTISSHERLPDGTEIWRAESAPPGTKLMVTSEELAESVGKPWRLIEETAYEVGKKLNLSIRKDENGETFFSKKAFSL